MKDPKDMRDLINISNLVVYPIISSYEKHEIPMVLLECMSMKKPIIMNDVSPMNEIIDGNDGVKVKDYSEMKNMLIKLIKDKNLSKKIGDRARKRIVNDFNIIKTAKNYSKLYNELY